MNNYTYTIHGTNKFGIFVERKYTFRNIDSEESGFSQALNLFNSEGFKMSSSVSQDLDWQKKLELRKNKLA